MRIKIVDISMYILAFTFCLMLYGGSFVSIVSSGCSKNHPIQPTPDPCDEAKPCEPVPCESVPCDSVIVEVPLGRVEGVWHITYVKDPDSVPQTYALLQNDILIWSFIDDELGTGEVTVEVPGNLEIGDKIEPFHKGSRSRFWYRFEVNVSDGL